MSGPLSFINTRPQTYFALKASLQLNAIGSAKFDALNAHIFNGIVLPGEVVIIGDLSTRVSTLEEAYLMRRAMDVHLSVLAEEAAADDFLLDHFDLLQGMLTYSTFGVGVAGDAWGRHLNAIQSTLEAIEALHKDYLKNGPGYRDTFYTQRRQLFRTLDKQLANLAAFGAGLRKQSSIKRMLGISTKRYLRTGDIAGYADKINGVAKAAKLIKRGTYIGVGLSTVSTALDIHKACTVGREEACREAKYVRGSGLVVGIGGSYVGGHAGTLIAGGTCTLLGVASAGMGALACVVIGGGVGGVVGGGVGDYLGEGLGRVIYQGQNK